MQMRGCCCISMKAILGPKVVLHLQVLNYHPSFTFPFHLQDQPPGLLLENHLAPLQEFLRPIFLLRRHNEAEDIVAT
jgi:hypothetical protein